MTLLILMIGSLALSLLLGLVWRWRLPLLFIVVVIISFLGSLYVAEFPPRVSIFHDVWSFLWFLLNYGIFFALVIGSGAIGTVVGLFVARRIGKLKK